MTETANPKLIKRVVADAQPIETRTAPALSYEVFLRDYVRAGRPVVVKNATPRWPAMRKWTPQFFKERFGDHMVQISYNERLSFSDFIDGVMASTIEKPGPYMYRLFLHEHLPEALPDVSPQNPYAFARRYASPLMMEYWRRPDGYMKLLIGGAGGRFPMMHFDDENAHATITEIYGPKEFIVYSPKDTPYMYVDPERGNISLVDDPKNQDLERFPLLAKATQYRSVLEPGDMVFVPCGWWHTARALGPSISIGQNTLDESNWEGFVNIVCGPLSGENLKPRKLLKRAYLKALGPVLGACERLQHEHPIASELMQFPKRVAPDTSHNTWDPALKPLKIRHKTG